MSEQKASHKTTTVGDITGSTVGSIGTARDVTLFMNNVDDAQFTIEEQEALKSARQKLEDSTLNTRSKEDVHDYLAKIVSEMKEPDRDEGRLKHLLRNVKDVAPPVAAALSIAASLSKLLT